MDGHDESPCYQPLLVMHLVASQGSKGRGYGLESNLLSWNWSRSGPEVVLERLLGSVSLWDECVNSNRGQFQGSVPTFGDLQVRRRHFGVLRGESLSGIVREVTLLVLNLLLKLVSLWSQHQLTCQKGWKEGKSQL